MKCPNCGKSVGDHDAICPSCGSELFIDTKLAAKIFEKREEPTAENSDKKKKDKAVNKVKRGLKFDLHSIKLIAIVLLSLLVIILVVVLIFKSISTKGEKYAKKAAEFIGSDFDTASKALDFKIKQESGYKGLTAVIDYNYVAESDDDVRIDGVTYPEWAVIFVTDDNDKIKEVRYCDFKSIKSDIKGVKKDHVVNIEKFTTGTDKSAIDKEIDMERYSVSYTKDGTAYIYRYWYENDSGDEQPVVLTIYYDNNGKFKAFTPQLLNHRFM